MESWENQLATEINSGSFEFSIVAANVGVGSIRYIIRIEKPNGDRIDYESSPEELKKLGELLLEIYRLEKDNEQRGKNELRGILTAENLRDFVNSKKTVSQYIQAP